MKKVTRMSKRRKAQAKRNIKKLFRTIIKDIYYLIVGLIYLIIISYEALENGFVKLFKKTPKWLLRIMIWTMLFNIFVLSNDPKIIEKIKVQTEIKEIYEVKELYVEPTKCAYGVYECAIYDTAIESGLTVEQGKIAIAISKHETANYTSSLFKNNNNIGGLYNGNAGKFFSYTSVEDGIDAYVGNLKRGYFDKGLTTIETIQKKYAPINATNDPTGLNEHWVSGVTYYYNQL